MTLDDRRAELDEKMPIHVSLAMLARCAYELGVRTGCSSTDVLYALFWRGGSDSTAVGGDTPAS